MEKIKRALKKANQLELNATERYLIRESLSRVVDCMEWDEDTKTYVDAGQFIMSIGKDDFLKLKSVVEKF